VSVWAGQTLYSAHRLVLALSSHYFRLVVTGLSGEGRHPVIFLKVRLVTGSRQVTGLSGEGRYPVIFLKVRLIQAVDR
jgi:hypothetical protein